MSSDDSTSQSCTMFGEWELRGTTLEPSKKLLTSAMNIMMEEFGHDRVFSICTPSSPPDDTLLIHQSVLLGSSSTKPLKALVTLPSQELSSSTITLHDEQDIKSFNAIRLYLYAQPIDLSKYDHSLALIAHRWEVFPLFNAFLQAMKKKYHGDVAGLVKLALALHHIPLPENFLIHLSVVIAHNFDVVEIEFGRAAVWGIARDDDVTSQYQLSGDSTLSSESDELEVTISEDDEESILEGSDSTRLWTFLKDHGIIVNEEIIMEGSDSMRLWTFLKDHGIIVDVIKYMMLFKDDPNYFDLVMHVVYNLEASFSDEDLMKILYYMDAARILKVRCLIHDNDKLLSNRIYQLSVRVYHSQCAKFPELISFVTRTHKQLSVWNWPFDFHSHWPISLNPLNNLTLSLFVLDNNVYARIKGTELSFDHRGKVLMRLMTTGSTSVGYSSSRDGIEFVTRFKVEKETEEKTERRRGTIAGKMVNKTTLTDQVFLLMSEKHVQNLRDSHHEGCSIVISIFSFFKHNSFTSNVSWIDDDLLE